MKIVIINSVLYGSTGKIALGIKRLGEERGNKVYICAPRGRHNKAKIFSDISNLLFIGNRISEDSHIVLNKLTGLNGFFSIFATYKFLKTLNEINPDVIHLHNLHNCYINIPMLFKYIKKHKIKVVWTLHDCWAFTGHCPYFTFCQCEKWKTGCSNCPQYRCYPSSYVDTSKFLWKVKKKIFNGVEDMTIVTPSEWLAKLVSISFLSNYQTKVINNGIDLSIFKPTRSNFRERNNCEDKFLILGVASTWEARKGIDTFVELSNNLSNDYQVVLVGTDDSNDKILPSNVISIHKTQNQHELAEIYSAADVFVNPTKEDNFPTVNIEAIACGTPVITYDTGGSSEMLDSLSGVVVEYNNFEELLKAIEFLEENPLLRDNCVERALNYDMNEKFSEYIDLYSLE